MLFLLPMGNPLLGVSREDMQLRWLHVRKIQLGSPQFFRTVSGTIFSWNLADPEKDQLQLGSDLFLDPFRTHRIDMIRYESNKDTSDYDWLIKIIKDSSNLSMKHIIQGKKHIQPQLCFIAFFAVTLSPDQSRAWILQPDRDEHTLASFCGQLL